MEEKRKELQSLGPHIIAVIIEQLQETRNEKEEKMVEYHWREGKAVWNFVGRSSNAHVKCPSLYARSY